MSDDKINNQTRDYRRDTNRTDQSNFNRARPAPSKPSEKSPFQKLMDETAQSSDFGGSETGSNQPTNTSTNEAIKGYLSQQDRFGKEKDSSQRQSSQRDSDHEEGGQRSGSAENGVPRGKIAEKRVIGRSSTSEKKSGGEGEGSGSMGQGRSGLGRRGKGGVGGPLEGKMTPELSTLSKTGFAMALEQATHSFETKEAQAKNPLLNKALIDQVVQYCRIISKTDGDKEIEMQLHEAIFKGLKLKVVSRKGKIEATFLAPSQEVYDLFQAQKSSLRETLKEKGIDVNDINIIMV